jgi:hypothetical protein
MTRRVARGARVRRRIEVLLGLFFGYGHKDMAQFLLLPLIHINYCKLKGCVLINYLLSADVNHVRTHPCVWYIELLLLVVPAASFNLLDQVINRYLSCLYLQRMD